MRMLDLFSGIGGFALAAEWVWGDELDITGFCEIEKYAQKVLQKNFPGVPIHDDITKLNGKDFKNIDLITGGFPCQDISVAGKGAGIKEGTRSGLWSELHRIISEVQPRFALIENVPMLTIRGGTRVIADLAEIGYDCEWQVIGADDVGAWHRRKRIWICSYPRYDESQGWDKTSERQQSKRRRKARIEPSPLYHDVPYTANTNDKTSKNKRGWTSVQFGRSSSRIRTGTTDVPDTDGSRFKREGELSKPTVQEGISRSGYNGGTGFWAVEPNVGRVAHGIPFRVDRLKGLGNAIVPQVAALIMEGIKNAQ